MIALPYHKEVWKDIKDYEGLYQISNFARVKSLERIVYFGKRKRVVKEKIISPKVDGGGYLQVCLYKNNECKTKHIHRLLAEAFIPNPDNLPEVDHINTNKTDNRIENLKWVSHKGQYTNPLTKQHLSEMQTGRKNHQYGKKGILNHNSKPVLQFDLDGNFIRYWHSARDVENEGVIGHSLVQKCCNHPDRYKTAGGYIWQYA